MPIFNVIKWKILFCVRNKQNWVNHLIHTFGYVLHSVIQICRVVHFCKYLKTPFLH
jgi:hypothetical protein